MAEAIEVPRPSLGEVTIAATDGDVWAALTFDRKLLATSQSGRNILEILEDGIRQMREVRDVNA